MLVPIVRLCRQACLNRWRLQLAHFHHYFPALQNYRSPYPFWAYCPSPLRIFASVKESQRPMQCMHAHYLQVVASNSQPSGVYRTWKPCRSQIWRNWRRTDMALVSARVSTKCSRIQRLRTALPLTARKALNTLSAVCRSPCAEWKRRCASRQPCT